MDNNKVYAIKFTGDNDYTNIACRSELRDNEGFKGLRYLTPPDRVHMIDGTIGEETAEGFKFVSTGYAPGEWDLKALTIDNFRNQFSGLVIADDSFNTMSTTAELYEHFNQF
jgi:hypothetical protein